MTHPAPASAPRSLPELVPELVPVVIVGAGPVGLAAAAHLLRQGLEVAVLEAGEDVGANVRSWSHVPMFSAWRNNLDAAAVELLRCEDPKWTLPDGDEVPTGGELVARYLEPLAATPSMRRVLNLGARVVAIGRAGVDKMRDAGRDEAPFVLRVETATGARRVEARVVLDATGAWATPAPAGADGLPARGETRQAAAGRLSYGIPDILGADRGRYAGRRSAVIGAGHSAIHAVLDLATLRAEVGAGDVVWILRKRSVEEVYAGRETDALRDRGLLATRIRTLLEAGEVTVQTPFFVEAFDDGPADAVRIAGRAPDGEEAAAVEVDQVVVTTGVRPDLSFLRELRLDLDPGVEAPRGLAPLIDPNIHSCGSVPEHGEDALRLAEPGLYLVGMKSYGRAPTFLLRTGYAQVRSVVDHLARRLASGAAHDAPLALPYEPSALDANPCSARGVVGGSAVGRAVLDRVASCC
ncbi:MAG: FAD-dependent oxidoreductase [Acidobacteriota bacterium]